MLPGPLVGGPRGRAARNSCLGLGAGRHAVDRRIVGRGQQALVDGALHPGESVLRWDIVQAREHVRGSTAQDP